MPQNPKATESTLGVLKARGSVANGFYHWKELNDKLDDEFMTWFQQIMKCSAEEFKKREFDKVQTEIEKVFDELGLDDDPWEDEDGDEDNLDWKRPEKNAADRKMGTPPNTDAPPKTANAAHWREVGGVQFRARGTGQRVGRDAPHSLDASTIPTAGQIRTSYSRVPSGEAQ